MKLQGGNMSNQSLNTDDQSQKKTSNKEKKALPIGLRLILGTIKYLFILVIIGGLIVVGYACYFVNDILKDATTIDTTNIYDRCFRRISF